MMMMIICIMILALIEQKPFINTSVSHRDGTITGITNPCQNGPGSNDIQIGAYRPARNAHNVL